MTGRSVDLLGGLSEQSRDVTAKILQVLTDAGTPLPTREIEERTGYGIRYGQLCYRMLSRLERLGALAKITLPDVRSRYWQLPTASPLPLGGRKVHALRASPPWRAVHRLTACGLEITDVDTVLTWAEFDRMVRAEKASDTPFWESRVCGKCAYEPRSGRAEWTSNPSLVVARSPRRLVIAELRALAALAAAHPDEFTRLLEAEQVLIALGRLVTMTGPGGAAPDLATRARPLCPQAAGAPLEVSGGDARVGPERSFRQRSRLGPRTPLYRGAGAGADREGHGDGPETEWDPRRSLVSTATLDRDRSSAPGAGTDPIHLFCCDEDIAMCGVNLEGEEEQERDDDTPVCPMCALVEDEGLPCPVPGCPGDDEG